MENFARFRDALKDDYRFSEWAGKTKEADGVLSQKFISVPEELGDYVFERRKAIPEGGKAFVEYYRSVSDENVRFAVTIIEHGSILGAHEGMIDHFSSCMATDLPRTEERDINVGDVGFAGHTDVQTSVFFTRNNLLVKVDNVGSTHISVKDIAEKIDQQIRNHMAT